jgi:hypothetical protein
MGEELPVRRRTGDALPYQAIATATPLLAFYLTAHFIMKNLGKSPAGSYQLPGLLQKTALCMRFFSPELD